MFLRSVILLIAVITQAVLSAPQFITFENGKIGVNFGGYHAEAGLGGLLTGNAAHGGLSASAGTPYGQQAGAGLGGSVDGRTVGGLYAGASAGNGVGASAALGGRVAGDGAYGGSGAEAHAGGISKKVVKLAQSPQQQVVTNQLTKTVNFGSRVNVQSDVPHQELEAPVVDQVPQTVYEKRIYKKKFLRRNRPKLVVRKEYITQAQPQYYEEVHSQPQPEFDYRKFLDFGFFANTASGFGGPQHVAPVQTYVQKSYVVPQQEVVYEKRFNVQSDAPLVATGGHSTNTASAGAFAGGSVGGASTFTATKNYGVGPTFFNDIFNIPISTLGAVNQFLNNKAAAAGGVSVHKTVEVGHA